MNKQQHMLMKVLQKIRVFDGLTAMEAQNLLSMCQIKKFAADEQVYRVGADSNDMFVLIQGKLKVVSATGEDLVEIPAGTSIGEMGLFTGHRRSATIMAAAASLGLVIEKNALQMLMQTETSLKGKILENVVALLADRLEETGQKLVAVTNQLDAADTRLEEMKQQLDASLQEETSQEDASEEEAAQLEGLLEETDQEEAAAEETAEDEAGAPE